MKTTLNTLAAGLFFSAIFSANVMAATCNAHPQRLRGTIQGRMDLRNGYNWMNETINGTVELALNQTGTGYTVTSLNGQAVVQGNVQGCFVSANTPISTINANGTLMAQSTITAQGEIIARANGQIDLLGNFWSLSNCPWGQSTSVMQHLGPLMGTGPIETFICTDGQPARLVGASTGTLSSGGRATYNWHLVEVLPTP